MERLLVVKLQAVGCHAEVLLNGIPVARAGGMDASVHVPVHEYTLAGSNRLELQVLPQGGATPAGQGERAHAHVRMLLPRIGHAVHEDVARTVGQIDWVDEPDARPLLADSLSLPVSFPRWRWLDAPVLDPSPAVQALVLDFLKVVAKDLAAGETDRFMQATRLRTDELALAYQRDPAEQVQRWRTQWLALHAAGPLAFEPLDAAALVLRPIAGGRLLDCLDPQGQPALRTVPDAERTSHAFALRVTVLEGQVHVLR